MKHSEQSYGESVEIRGRCSILKIESSTKELHAKQSKDQNEEEKEEE